MLQCTIQCTVCTQHCPVVVVVVVSSCPQSHPAGPLSVSQQQHRQRLSCAVLNVLHKTLNEWVVWTALHCWSTVGDERSNHKYFPVPPCWQWEVEVVEMAPSPALLAVGDWSSRNGSLLFALPHWLLNIKSDIQISDSISESLTGPQSSWKYLVLDL